MQYIAGLFGLVGPSASMPNVFMYDSRDNVDLNISSLDEANVVARKARAVLAFNGYLNPVRGLMGGKYHFTLLKYSFSNSISFSDTTDIVTQTEDGVLSGNSSIAEAQTYIAITSGRSNLYLTTGMIAGKPIWQPPVNVRDGNCPYGQTATVYYGNSYVDQFGTKTSSTSNVRSSIGACKTVSVQAQETPTVLAETMQTPTSLTATGTNGTPGLLPSVAYDGTFFQEQIGDDESIILDRGFFYHSYMQALIKLDTNDFNPVSAVPGARPRWRVNKQQITL